jgi:MoaA/NifB/PqqE/SkfB family radical SAM enzyme
MFFYEDFTKKIINYKISRFITEIHAHTAKLHDSITKAPGSFEQTTRGIKNLLKHGANVEIRLVIHRLNYRHLKNIAKYVICNFSGIDSIVLFPIDLVGNAYKNRHIVSIRYREIIKNVEDAVDYLQRRVNVRLYHFPLCLLRDKYRSLAVGKTAPKRRLAFPDVCKPCVLNEKCPGLWKTYAINIGVDEIKPILQLD